MGTLTKSAVFVVVVSAAVVFVRHSATALRPSLPKDMPSESRFLQTGFNLQVNEPEGDWVACGQDPDQQTNFCRISDAHGIIVYQGDFLPVHTRGPLPSNQLDVAALSDTRLWMASPSQATPIPAIPLRNGELLVPAGDRDALADRWATHPDELQTIASNR